MYPTHEAPPLRRAWRSLITAAALMGAALAAHAQASPIGLWKTIDDKQPGKAKSLIRISESAGVYSGRVEKLIDPALQGKACDKCSGERANKPIEGMTVIVNMRKEGDALYAGGELIDVEGGGVYRGKMMPAADGKTMEVRGFIGFSLLGRSQTWERVE